MRDSLISLCQHANVVVRCRMTTAFVDFNGVVPEKFDAVKLSHLVDAEYGNQGVDFKMVPREGFGWMNGAFLPLPLPLRCPLTRTTPNRMLLLPLPNPSCIPSRSHVPVHGHAPRRIGVHEPRGVLRKLPQPAAAGTGVRCGGQRPARLGDGHAQALVARYVARVGVYAGHSPARPSRAALNDAIASTCRRRRIKYSAPNCSRHPVKFVLLFELLRLP